MSSLDTDETTIRPPVLTEHPDNKENPPSGECPRCRSKITMEDGNDCPGCAQST